MSLRPFQNRQITCEMCGRECHAEQKDRNICRTCLRREPSRLCIRCRRMKHLVSAETGLCPRCTRIAARPLAVCTRCLRTRIIYHQQKQLCHACDKRERTRARNKDKQIKVACSVCGQMRYSMLLSRPICPACWREERNGRGICSGCKKLKVFQVKDRRLCKQCYKDYLAPQSLQRYVDDFTTPYPYNRALFDRLACTIGWESVTSKVHQKFRVWGHFLQTQELSEPLTWEAIIEALPTLGSTNRTQPKLVGICLLELGHLLAARGELESWETYVARRSALQPLEDAPSAMRGYLHRYTAWLWERRTAPSNVRAHLEDLASFWSWCAERGIASPEEVQAALVNDYLLALYWHWRCSNCQGTVAFEPGKRKAPMVCAHCGALGTFAKEKRYVQNTVRSHRANLYVFFEWLKINRLVVTNPVQRKIPAPSPSIQHYPLEVIKQLCASITAPDADPVEAVILYLIIFHALSVWELRHTTLPTLFPLGQGIATPTLAEAYYVIVPGPAPTRGDRSPGRPDIRLDFPAKAAPCLKLLLTRFECQRQHIAGDSKNRYLFITASTARHNTPISQFFIWKNVRQATLRVLGGACNPNTLRKTAGVIFADRAGAGVLRWMGWDDHQAFAYSYAPREVVQPQPSGGSRGTNQPTGAEPVLFPSP